MANQAVEGVLTGPVRARTGTIITTTEAVGTPRVKRDDCYPGGMFWLSRKKLSGSYFFLRAFKRSYLAAP
jgi:hypothetical protein